MTASDAGSASGPLDELWRELGAVLSEQEDSLERLLYKLEQEHLLMVTGRTKWLGHATEEVLAVGEDLNGLDERRKAAVGRLAVALGVPATATLGDLLEHAPPAWAEVLAEHRRLMRAGVMKVQEITSRNRGYIADRLSRTAAAGTAYPGSVPQQRTGTFVTGSM